jgi:uncharacterized protein (TIGR04255 family)
MPISFEKAPLLELIVECRWGSQQDLNLLATQQPVQLLNFAGGTKIEEFFMQLGGELSQNGFQRSERLIPLGFPSLPNQPVVRYRSNNAPTSSILFQVGAGIFSIHAIPPYHSWEGFLPFVEIGINALLKSRIEPDNKQAISSLTLRYVDLFGHELTQGLSVLRFMSEVLGISLGIPEPLVAMSQSREPSSINVTFVLPIPGGTMNVNVADGTAANRPGIIMNMAITSKEPINAETGAIISFLNNSHDMIHNAFIKITAPIHKAMHPSGGIDW